MQDARRNTDSIYLGDSLKILNINSFPDGDVLAYRFSPSPHQVEVGFVRGISPQEMRQIKNARARLSNFSNCCDLYEICEMNYHSIIVFHSQLGTSFWSNHNRMGEFLEETSLELNRLLLNYLSSFKTFLAHLETRYKRLLKKQPSNIKNFKQITSHCYDGNFYYRFFYKLRNYVQHCALPVEHIQIKEGQNSVEISIDFNRDSLINNYNEWGPVKEGLLRQPERFSVIDSLEILRKQLIIINDVVMSMEINIVLDSYNNINGLINEVATQHPKGQPFIGRLERSSTGKPVSLIADNFPFPGLDKFRMKCEEMQK